MAGPFTLTFSTGITAPPGTGNFDLNTAAQDQATTVWISDSTAGTPSTDITNVLSAITVGQELYFQDQNDASRWQQYQVTALPVASSGYSAIAVSWIKGGFDLPPQRCAFSILPAGQPTYPPPIIGPSPVPPSAPGQPNIIYGSGSATNPATPISITGSPIIPTSPFPPGGGVGSIGDPSGVPTFPPPTPPPIGSVPVGPLVGPAVAPAPFPPSLAGVVQPQYKTGSATSPTAASFFPAFTATGYYAGYPNQPPAGVPIVFANIFTKPTLSGGVWTVVTPPSTPTTAQIILNGWGLPGPSGLGPGPPSYPNPPGAGLPHVFTESVSGGYTESPERSGGTVFLLANPGQLHQPVPPPHSRRKRMSARGAAGGADQP